MPKPRGLVAAILAVGVMGCSSKPQLRIAGPPIEWGPGQAERANGPAPVDVTPASVCGSSTETYLAELFHTAPDQLKVLRDWGDIVPGGKQILVSGTVAATHLGPTDLPITHVFGDDLSMDIKIGPAFLPFARQLGPASEPTGQLHVELASGLIPHDRRPSSTAQTWRQQSDLDLTGILSGFDKPAIGDPIVVMGRWIVDCGHGNYGTELHPMSFLAWAHTTGNVTTVHTYANPYRDTEMYSPDASVLGKVSDTGRLTAPGSKPFPGFLIDDVIRLATGKIDHLRSQAIVEAVRASPPTWTVCAPGGASGRTVRVRYDFVARSGVDVHVTTTPHTGCASVDTAIGSPYKPLDLQLRQCGLPWADLDAAARDATGAAVDIRGLIKGFLPAAARPAVDRDPDTTCAEALTGPGVAAIPRGRTVRTDDSQAFPFYGVITIELT